MTIGRLGFNQLRLPRLDCAMGGNMLWPPPSTFNPQNVLSPAMREFSEARGPEARRIGEEVAEIKREEANSSKRRIP